MSFYKHHLFFCTNQRENGAACCADFNARELRDYAKEQVKKLKLSGPKKCRINNAGCLDRCALGPVLVVYPEGTWYRYTSKADIDEIIAEHVQNGRVVKRLLIDQ